MCRSYGDQFEILVKDKRDISSYLKKQLDLRNEQAFDLNDRLIGLQKVKEKEKEFLEKKFQDFKDQSQAEIERLENDNMLLKTRLLGLEDFKSQRQTMETTIEDLKKLIQEKEDAYKHALDQMEIALIHFKNRLKKEAIEYLNDLAMEFRRDSKNQISKTIKRAIHENFHLNNQIDYLSKELEKSIEITEKSRGDNEHLTRTVAILEDIEQQSAKKIFTMENIVRMLNDKLKQCKEEKRNSIKEMNLPRTTGNEPSKNSIHRSTSMPIENTSNDLEEENQILKEIISRAASAIADVIQSVNNPDPTMNIEKRNEMLEQFLALLLASDHINLTDKKSKGIYPGSRLGLHHYSPGDLGLIRTA